MKKFLYILLSLFLVFAPAYAYATTSVGGWTLTDSLIAGANTTINATKTAGGKVLNSAVTVGASAAKVGKHLIKGGGTAALLLAVPQIIGDGVDWVLDPANNAVKYKDISPNNYKYRYCLSNGTCYYTPDSACRALVNTDPPFKYHSYTAISPPISYLCRAGYNELKPDPYTSIVFELNPNYVDGDKWKSIPISTVAAKVISNAEAGHAPSQEAVKATALEGFAAGEYDAALDAAATEVGTENPPDTVDPDTPTDPNVPPVPPPAFELPAFCSWAAPVCAFATWAQQEWSEFILTITALKDWLFEESPSDKDNTVDVVTPPIIPAQVAIDFVGGCPAPLTFSFNFYGQNYKPAVPFDPICEVAILINPVVKICATIGAAFIVAGIRQGEK
ncbi:virulence factor TspB C-terminal domain-related protein [Psychrobacter sp.]|uniref:virulence factor TspB C-terminal domain-related protein n=1 Tax=Psychrobacter sp. TaxID=56811 RepID=UPI003C7469B9